jgi:hypothetical protein
MARHILPAARSPSPCRAKARTAIRWLRSLILTVLPIIETTDEVTVCENALPYIWNGTPYPAGGTFTVTLPGQGEECDTLATLILTVVPVIEATETVEVCENALPYIWNGTPYPAGGTFTVTLPGQGEDCDTLATLILTIAPLPYIETPYPVGGTTPGQGESIRLRSSGTGRHILPAARHPAGSR